MIHREYHEIYDEIYGVYHEIYRDYGGQIIVMRLRREKYLFDHNDRSKVMFLLFKIFVWCNRQWHSDKNGER